MAPLTMLNKPIGPIGYGLMGFTWRQNPVPYDQAFAAMRTALAKGANLWNGGEIYGPPDANSLQLLHAYFEKYPEDAEKGTPTLETPGLASSACNNS